MADARPPKYAPDYYFFYEFYVRNDYAYPGFVGGVYDIHHHHPYDH